MASSSKASDSSSHRGPKRPDQGLGKDTSGPVALHGKLTQLRRQIQSAHLASIKEKLEANRRALQRHTCALFDVAAAAEAASRGEGGNALSQRAAEGQSRLVGWDLVNVVKMAVQYMRRVIQRRAKFDIMDLNVVQFAPKTFIPALFGHASNDMFIQPHHSDRIHQAYAGIKISLNLRVITIRQGPNFSTILFQYSSIMFCTHLSFLWHAQIS